MLTVKNKNKGFTIVEIIFVVGFFAAIGAITLPFSMDAYRHYLLSSETQMVVSILRRARDMAIANKYGDDFGISIEHAQYVLFRGESYSSRIVSFDELYPRAESVAVAPVGEIVFLPISGRPKATAVLTLTASGSTQIIDINPEGMINW